MDADDPEDPPEAASDVAPMDADDPEVAPEVAPNAQPHEAPAVGASTSISIPAVRRWTDRGPMKCSVAGCRTPLHANYNRANRICPKHRASPVLLMDGVPQRFCHRCHRFHGIEAFDGALLGCREALARCRETQGAWRRAKRAAEARAAEAGAAEAGAAEGDARLLCLLETMERLSPIPVDR